jgi:thiol:disulfide interchange protein
MAAPDGTAVRGPTRRDPRLLFWAAGLLLAGRIATGVWADRHPVAAQDLVKWHAVAGAEAEAKRAKKPLLYDFTAAWCPPCRKLAKEVFGDAEAAAFINANFVPVRVMDRSREDGKNPPEIEALQKRFGITAFPTLIVTGGGRKPVTLEGYAGKAETVKALKDAVGAAKGSGRSGSGSSDRGR